MPHRTEDYQTWVKVITALFILSILEEGAAHGNKINEEIKRRTDKMLNPNPNVLYPLLRAMEEKGYIAGSWDNVSTRNKRIYTITNCGKASIPVLREKVDQHLCAAEQKLKMIRCSLLARSQEEKE
ncbi:PadR family transcriptional regulator [Anaerospora hongkongensis]|uniref:PadR family transcriptional regulator n=1 Tax=Anaerospora hongkongensis TaxID=244830 RepID=UPI00289C5CB6|nr:PadR family transcriptional regulator [Anaerospora hongkongensis]